MARIRLPLLAASALAALVTCVAPAAAQSPPPSGSGSCGVGALSPRCYFWTGKVTFIGDGDTISVDLDGDSTKKPVHVRLTGIQAMEEHVYTNVPKDRKGDCHANEATARLEHLIKAGKGRVRLAAQNPASMSGNRLRREVAVKVRGKWRDVGRTLMNEGHALWLPNGAEWAWNASYSILAERAARRGLNLWDPEYCKPGPAANLRMWVNSDADGSDGENVNGEWVRIKNLDPSTPLPVGGWWVRDSGLRRYTLPAGASVPPNSTITVYVGKGTDTATATDFFWGLRGPIFDNASTSHGSGDGAYLFDPDGDLRAAMQYPCRSSCSDPYQHKVKLTAHYKRQNEYVSLTNVSGEAVDLEGYRLASKPYTYAFPAGSVIQPGQTMRVYTQGPATADQPLIKHWGRPGPILRNAGDSVRLSTFTYIDIDCSAWGSVHC